VLLILGFSHFFASKRFWQYLRNGQLPGPVDFSVISVVLYFDVGITLELLNVQYLNPFFSPFFATQESTILIATILIAIAPWLLLAGARFVFKRPNVEARATLVRMAPRLRILFYILTICICIITIEAGTRAVRSGMTMWQASRIIGEEWGPFIIILYMPLHLLALYLRQEDSRTKLGLIFTIFLGIMAIASTLAINERTNILLPILAISMFRGRISLLRLAVIAVSLLISASLLLPIMKWQYSERGLSPTELLVETLSNDYARAPVLASALEQSKPLGTSIMPYSFSGYVYSSLFFVPRSIASFKGRSTATHFTAHITNTSVEFLGDWGFGICAIGELSVNGGLLLIVPGLILYGIALGGLDRMSHRFPSLLIPTRLGPLWLFGYHLPALLLTFGTMALVCFAGEIFFVKQKLDTTAESLRATTLTDSANRL